jgi:hypothetical protein
VEGKAGSATNSPLLRKGSDKLRFFFRFAFRFSGSVTAEMQRQNLKPKT